MQVHVQEEFKRKRRIEKDKETVKPTVINDRLIKQYMVEYNLENRIFDDDQQIWQLAHLALAFKSKCSH